MDFRLISLMIENNRRERERERSVPDGIKQAMGIEIDSSSRMNTHGREFQFSSLILNCHARSHAQNHCCYDTLMNALDRHAPFVILNISN